MKMKLLFSYVVLLLSPIVIALADLQQHGPYNVSGIIPAVFVFGDSAVDTGNNNWIPTLAKANTPLYGKNLKGGMGNGRFCDGKVPSDLFVELLGIKELLPPYLDPRLQAKDLITGVTFASAASGYDPETLDIMKPLTMPQQLELFKEYIKKLKGIVGETRASEIVSNSLYIVLTGHNDIQFTASFKNPSYIDIMINFASTFLQEMYNLGARRIGVFGVKAIGCVPFHRNSLGGGIHRNCIHSLNSKAYSFNNKLSIEINSLVNKFPDSRIVYLDFYNFLLDLINNPTKYGYKIVKNGCCAIGGRIELVVPVCPIACPNDDEFVFWDSFHLAEKGYRLLVHQVLQQHLQTFIS